MPYQVKKGSLTIVASTSVDALVTFDAMSKSGNEPVLICDMDGREIDPDALRPATAEEEKNSPSRRAGTRKVNRPQ